MGFAGIDTDSKAKKKKEKKRHWKRTKMCQSGHGLQIWSFKLESKEEKRLWMNGDAQALRNTAAKVS